jgi:uncharacterized protein
MDNAIQIAGVLALLLLVGGVVGMADRKAFSARWLLVAAGLVLLNDFLLTRGYHTLPKLLPGAEWNWQGKLLALSATLVIAATPAFGWRRSGLTLAQAPGSLKTALPVALAYGLIFIGVALLFPRGESSPETVAFQATMPGLEEEAFYRGLLLLALDRAFGRRWRFLGVQWGWGAVFSCALFGLAHALGFSDGRFAFDAATMAMTGGTAFLAVWMRYRTGSILLPILMHNFGNSIFEFI